VASEYGKLKQKLGGKHSKDRVAYTQEKGAFITKITQKAKLYYASKPR